MVELVIKISEGLYQDIKEHGLCGYCSDREIMSEAIANGTPLPKGHGKLCDLDAALKCVEETADCDVKYYAMLLFDWAMSKRVLIEADKESEG